VSFGVIIIKNQQLKTICMWLSEVIPWTFGNNKLTESIRYDRQFLADLFRIATLHYIEIVLLRMTNKNGYNDT